MNNVAICKRENYSNITDTRCLPKILKGQPSVCTTINNQHIASAEEILPGILLLNQFQGVITTENKEINLQGSFLIKYHNTTITIANQTYANEEISIVNPQPVIAQSVNASTDFEEIISLEMLKEIYYKFRNPHLRNCFANHNHRLDLAP